MLHQRHNHGTLVAVCTALALWVALLPGIAAAVVPAPPALASRSYVLLDAATGRIIAEQDAHQPAEPASLTKLMTVYVVLQEIAAGNLSKDEMVRVSEKAWRTGGSRTFLEVGTQVSVEDLLSGVIVQSGNDASIVLAEHVAGSEEVFAEMMNVQAARLGMQNSHFENATGLPAPGHLTTAADMALLALATLRDFPQDYTRYAQREFTYNGIRQPNRNRLLWRDRSVDGLKTGHTEAAGYCLVASALRDGQRLVAATMGAPSDETRFADAQKLLNYGFRFFETHTLLAAAEVFERRRVYGGAQQTAALGVYEPLLVTVPRGSRERITLSVTRPEPLEAPVSRGQVVGSLQATLDGDLLAKTPLVALEPVARGSLWRRLEDSVRRWLE